MLKDKTIKSNKILLEATTLFFWMYELPVSQVITYSISKYVKFENLHYLKYDKIVKKKVSYNQLVFCMYWCLLLSILWLNPELLILKKRKMCRKMYIFPFIAYIQQTSSILIYFRKKLWNSQLIYRQKRASLKLFLFKDIFSFSWNINTISIKHV